MCLHSYTSNTLHTWTYNSIDLIAMNSSKTLGSFNEIWIFIIIPNDKALIARMSNWLGQIKKASNKKQKYQWSCWNIWEFLWNEPIFFSIFSIFIGQKHVCSQVWIWSIDSIFESVSFPFRIKRKPHFLVLWKLWMDVNLKSVNLTSK